MAEITQLTEDYIARLADGLEALGPIETGDVVAEIRAHISDAAAQSETSEASVLAEFGDPDTLAARILEERGVLGTDSTVPEAPQRLRTLALVVDVIEWMATGVMLYVVITGWVSLLAFGGHDWFPTVGITVLFLMPILGWTVRQVRQQTGPAPMSDGMRLAGLKRIRVGSSMRVVREADIPGTPKTGRVPYVITTALALLLVAAFVVLMAVTITRNDASATQSRVQTAVTETGVGVAVVSDIYRQVASNAPASEVAGNFAPSGKNALAELLQRRARGRIATYSIASASMPASSTPPLPWDPPGDVTVLVTVSEFAMGSATPAAWEYRVVSRQLPSVTYNGLTVGSAGAWQVESAAPARE